MVILKKELNEYEGSIDLFSNALEIKPILTKLKSYLVFQNFMNKRRNEKKDIILKILELIIQILLQLYIK